MKIFNNISNLKLKLSHLQKSSAHGTAYNMVYVLRSRKDSLGLAMKELARHIEPKGGLNVTYTRDVRRNGNKIISGHPWPVIKQTLKSIEKICITMNLRYE